MGLRWIGANIAIPPNDELRRHVVPDTAAARRIARALTWDLSGRLAAQILAGFYELDGESHDHNITVLAVRCELVAVRARAERAARLSGAVTPSGRPARHSHLQARADAEHVVKDVVRACLDDGLAENHGHHGKPRR